MSGSTNQNEKERGFIFTPKVEEEGRIDEFPGLNNVPEEQMELIEVNPREVLDDDELDTEDKIIEVTPSAQFVCSPEEAKKLSEGIETRIEADTRVEMALMGEGGKIIPDIDLRSVKTPEELIVITEEIKKEVESEVEIEGKLMEGVEEGLPGESVPEASKELTDEEKKALYIKNLKESRIRFHPVKNAVKTVGVHAVESLIGRIRQVKDKEVQTNLTTNQFGRTYRKARKRKNKLQKQSRKNNR
jgi:hypothetical protein